MILFIIGFIAWSFVCMVLGGAVQARASAAQIKFYEELLDQVEEKLHGR